MSIFSLTTTKDLLQIYFKSILFFNPTMASTEAHWSFPFISEGNAGQSPAVVQKPPSTEGVNFYFVLTTTKILHQLEFYSPFFKLIMALAKGQRTFLLNREAKTGQGSVLVEIPSSNRRCTLKPTCQSWHDILSSFFFPKSEPTLDNRVWSDHRAWFLHPLAHSTVSSKGRLCFLEHGAGCSK